MFKKIFASVLLAFLLSFPFAANAAEKTTPVLFQAVEEIAEQNEKGYTGEFLFQQVNAKEADWLITGTKRFSEKSKSSFTKDLAAGAYTATVVYKKQSYEDRLFVLQGQAKQTVRICVKDITEKEKKRIRDQAKKDQAKKK